MFQKGKASESHTMKLTDELIQRLEEAGFKWSPNRSKFDERFMELMAYKHKFGHCSVPQKKTWEV